MAAFMRNQTTSAIVNEAMTDLFALKKPNAVMMQKKNSLQPFEGAASETKIEFMSQRNDAPFLLIGSHSKKRPHNMVLVRTFDYHPFDMIELSIVRFRSIREIHGPSCAIGVKPAFIFNGEMWEQREEYKCLQSMLLDLFRGEVVDQLHLTGVESVISVTATADLILFRVYRVLLKKSATNQPVVDLALMGPAIDWRMGRSHLAPEALMREALKKPSQLLPKKKVKNVTTNPLRETLGRVHMGQQKIETIQTRKMKAFKRARTENRDQESP